MAQQGVQRKLVAILSADVVGYSRLMGTDEEGTLSALKEFRREVIDPSIEAHHGHIVKVMGDGMLAEFPSVVEAVKHAVEVQLTLAERNVDIPEDRRIEFRVGINLGDVIVEGKDIYGDGVNVAARLQELANPGGISIPQKVFEEVRNKLDVGFEFLGDQSVKNIERPIPVYRVLLEPEAAGTVIGETPGRRRLWQQPVLAGLGVVLLMIGGIAIWRSYHQPDIEPGAIERMAFPLPKKPSIAVLPFTNMSEDPAQEFFSDGLTEDIITGLSRFSALFVWPPKQPYSKKVRRSMWRRSAGSWASGMCLKEVFAK